jgi:hypothetical protein
MTYRIALIFDNGGSRTSIDVGGVPMAQMKTAIRQMIAKHNIPHSATLHVEQEEPRTIYFRGVLSSVPSLTASPAGI